MSLNTSHTPDGRGVLIYNGEMILLYTSDVKVKFENFSDPIFKGGKSGALYLTSHRIIFMNSKNEAVKSFAMPFHSLRNVKLEQPLLGANYLKGEVEALPGGNFEGIIEWRLSFPKGGCIDFGQALLRAADMASKARPFAAPPSYAPAPQSYYSAPPNYYISGGNYNGFQAPTHAFPEQPPAGNVFMYESPPPYPGIAGQTAPFPAGGLQFAGGLPNQHPSAPRYENVPHLPPAQPPSYTPYAEAPPLPEKH
ncbi:unnamed protein product [Caenorhabditis auriculariae]|uniref:GRAM domain-containing protein n=1 Tax=Caenorhabditis auriculariae TaxID=2777116 RepID=A0A8S1H5U8_9PELO|nr:unnamed protein product [Caenorhabditis auriculariae]